MANTDSGTVLDAVADIVGVATSDRSSPLLSPRAINADFRDGIRTRPGLYGMSVFYDNEEQDRDIFEHGNVQLFAPYQDNNFRPSGFVILIAGTVFWAGLAGHTMYVRRLFDGLDASVLFGWHVQAFGWFIIQNGVDAPIVWDGYSQSAFQSKPENGEIPVGTCMAFIHHRIVVVSADGQDKLAVSDLWRADRTDAVWKFSESTVWANAGVFGLHANFGRIMALEVIPQNKRTPNGDGALLIIGTLGSQTLNLQGPRASWIDSQIQDTANMGAGLASLYGHIVHNSKLYYIAADGVRQWSPSSVDGITGDSDAHISGDVEHYWKMSDPNNREILPVGLHDSRLFFGIYPQLLQSREWGNHRFCNAWLTLDTLRRSRNGQALPLSWYGLNCGIRPIQYASNLLLCGTHRSYVISHDADNVNRVYEITSYLRDDIVENEARKVKAMIDFPLIGTDARSGKWLLPKKPTQLRIDYTEADGEVTIEAFSRPDDAFCLEPWGQLKACVPSNDLCGVRPLHRGRQTMGAPDGGCGLASTQYRVRLKITGSVRIATLIGSLQIENSASIFSREDASCGSCSGSNSSASTCCEEDDLYQAINEPIIC